MNKKTLETTDDDFHSPKLDFFCRKKNIYKSWNPWVVHRSVFDDVLDMLVLLNDPTISMPPVKYLAFFSLIWEKVKHFPNEPREISLLPSIILVVE